MGKLKDSTIDGTEIVAAGPDKGSEVTTPAVDIDFGSHADAGFENTNKDSFTVNSVYLIQKMSQILEPGSANYNPEAEAGMFCNGVSNDVFHNFDFVQVSFEQVFDRYSLTPKGIKDTKAYLGEIAITDPLVQQGVREPGTGFLNLGDNTALFDVRKHYVLLINQDGSCSPALIRLGSTQIPKSKKLMTYLRSQTMVTAGGEIKAKPTWATVMNATGCTETSKENKTFSGWRFTAIHPLTNQAVHLAAVAFNSMVRSNKAAIVIDGSSSEIDLND